MPGCSGSAPDRFWYGCPEVAEPDEEAKGRDELKVPRQAGERPQATLAGCAGAEARSRADEPDEIRVEPEQRHDLRDPSPADAVEPGQLGPVVHHSGVEGVLELVREVEHLQDSWCSLAPLPLGIAGLPCRPDVDDDAGLEVLV